MLVVALSMCAALLLGAGTILVDQAAISAILAVATLQPSSSPSPSRFVDALIGGAVALLVGQVLFPRDPVRAMAKAARPVVSDLAAALACVRGAHGGDEGWRGGRSRSRAAPTTTSPGATTRSRWRARRSSCARPGRRMRERVPLYAEAAQQTDYVVRNTRV